MPDYCENSRQRNVFGLTAEPCDAGLVKKRVLVRGERAEEREYDLCDRCVWMLVDELATEGLEYRMTDLRLSVPVSP